MTDDHRTAISAALATGLSLAEATLDVARHREPDRRPVNDVFGPQHDAVLDVLGRLGRINAAGVRAAEQSAADSWGWSDREPAPYVLRRALTISGQPTDEALAVLDAAVSCITVMSDSAERALTLGFHAVTGAHLLSAVDWSHWTRPLAAAVGPVPYPRSELAARVPGCGLPVGSHLFRTWTTTGHSCSCEHPFPGLSSDGTRVAKTIAEQSTDWAACLRAAHLLDDGDPPG